MSEETRVRWEIQVRRGEVDGDGEGEDDGDEDGL